MTPRSRVNLLAAAAGGDPLTELARVVRVARRFGCIAVAGHPPHIQIGERLGILKVVPGPRDGTAIAELKAGRK